MAKKVAGQLKLQVPAGQGEPLAARRPGAGSARHQHHGILQGVQRQDAGDGGRPADARSIITYFTDKSFTMEIKTPPASLLLKKAAELTVGVETSGQGRRRAR